MAQINIMRLMYFSHRVGDTHCTSEEGVFQLHCRSYKPLPFSLVFCLQLNLLCVSLCVSVCVCVLGADTQC